MAKGGTVTPNQSLSQAGMPPSYGYGVASGFYPSIGTSGFRPGSNMNGMRMNPQVMPNRMMMMNSMMPSMGFRPSMYQNPGYNFMTPISSSTIFSGGLPSFGQIG